MISTILLSHCKSEVCISWYTPFCACVCVYFLLYPPSNHCFDDETELRPSLHLPPLLFCNLFRAFLHLICLAFFYCFLHLLGLPADTHMQHLFLEAVRIFLCFNSAIFFIYLFHCTSVPLGILFESRPRLKLPRTKAQHSDKRLRPLSCHHL